MNVPDILRRAGLEPGALHPGHGTGIPDDAQGTGEIVSISPATEEPLGRVRAAGSAAYEATVARATAAFARWRLEPAPRRGLVVRALGEELRARKEALGALVSLEVGKIAAEGVGEIQEAIDIADFAVGLSRQLYGLSMHSERPSHRMLEQWHPLGPVGVITAFNFPAAVWAWNALIAAVCGDTVVWKPSHLTPLVSIAIQKICDQVFDACGHPGVMGLVVGDSDLGKRLAADRRIPLVSATGSCRMGREVAQVVAGRFGRTILELGGNNAITVEPDADLDLAVRAILFGAVGTAGQRCTSTRRLFLHERVYDTVIARLVAAYSQVSIGDPLAPGTLMGPLASAGAVAEFERAVATLRASPGVRILAGGGRPPGERFRRGFWVQPTLVAAPPDLPLLAVETFAPILYCVRYTDLADAIRWNNDVPQGLSSAIFTGGMRAAERFLSAAGSDCGIANVNIGTSGAEIGGAFGGEKDTGGGREAGSDSWKQYMRRQTCTLNYGADLPLAQGIRFG